MNDLLSYRTYVLYDVYLVDLLKSEISARLRAHHFKTVFFIPTISKTMYKLFLSFGFQTSCTQQSTFHFLFKNKTSSWRYKPLKFRFKISRFISVLNKTNYNRNREPSVNKTLFSVAFVPGSIYVIQHTVSWKEIVEPFNLNRACPLKTILLCSICTSSYGGCTIWRDKIGEPFLLRVAQIPFSQIRPFFSLRLSTHNSSIQSHRSPLWKKTDHATINHFSVKACSPIDWVSQQTNDNRNQQRGSRSLPWSQ